VVRSSDYDLSWHTAIVKENSKFESTPALRIPIEKSAEIIYSKFCEFLEKYSEDVLIQFELPYVLRVKIKNKMNFIRSLYERQKTKDLTIFKVQPDVVFEVQELEYEIKLFLISKSF